MVELRRPGRDRHARSRRAGEAPRVQHLVANAAAIQNVIDLTRAVRTLQADGYIIQRDDLAQLSPYETRRLKRFGDYTLSLSPLEPFDAELILPFNLDDAEKPVATTA